MSLEPIKKTIFTKKFSKEEGLLKDIKKIITDTTGVDAGLKLPQNNKLTLTVNNSSAASEINLRQQELLDTINTYLVSNNYQNIDTITIRQS